MKSRTMLWRQFADFISESLGDGISSESALDRIRQRGVIRVGVSLGFTGLSSCGDDGVWTGFDVDIGHAVAAAILGRYDAVELVPLASTERFDALNDGRIDIGSYNSSVTYTREAVHGAAFVHPILFDGEIFATPKSNVRASGGVDASIRDVDGTRIGMFTGSTTAENVERYCGRVGLSYTPKLYGSPQEALAAYLAGEFDLYCIDRYLLAGELVRAGGVDDHVILTDQVSLEAMSPVALASDWQLVRAVKWVLYALIEADNLGLTCGTADEEPAETSTPYLRRFLSPDAESARNIGLVPDFTMRILKLVGSYGDVFERNLGAQSPLKQQRRANNQRALGGMLYAPLFI
jgi:polar amino acid transport system substrate-binding protein